MLRIVETLARFPLFKSFTKDEIERLDTLCAWRRAKSGESLLDYEDGGEDVYFVLSGKVRVLIQTISGKESILREIGEGDYFGELAAIDGLPRSASIVALTDATIAKMPAATFRALMSRPEVSGALLARLAAQIRRLTERVAEFSALDVPGRIRAELLRLSRPEKTGAGALISPPPTHAELAARVACRREAVTRELSALARAGLVERRRGAIVLNDPSALAASVEAMKV